MGEHEEFRERVLTSLAAQQEMLGNILKQTENTTLRVSKLEEKAKDHDTIHAIHEEGKKRSEWWRDKLVGTVVGIACAAIGFLALLILQKTDIVDVSVVTPEKYDAISATLSE